MKILIVVDKEAENIKEYLEDFTYKNPLAGIKTAVRCEIETSVRIGEAEEKINSLKDKKQFYDIIIIDMEIEEKKEGGLELIKKILKLSSIKIVLTAHPSIPNCVECLNAGVFDYIEKNPPRDYDPLEKLKDSMRKGLEQRLQKPFDPFMRWLNKNLSDFIEKYSGEHIAVIDEIVVEHDLNYDSLMERVKKNYPFHHPSISAVPGKEDKERLFLQ